MNAILTAWEARPPSDDDRHLAYMLATTYHETSQEMLPIEEYGRGEGMEYGNPDPETGQTYYGRGFVQLTWADNYLRADEEIGLPTELQCYPQADNALRPLIAAMIMFRGMMVGWFRGGESLPVYFDDSTDDAYGAREIINGDKSKVPSWSGGVSIGNLIKGYHQEFLVALQNSYISESTIVPPQPEVPSGLTPNVVQLAVDNGHINLVVKKLGSVSIIYDPPLE